MEFANIDLILVLTVLKTDNNFKLTMIANATQTICLTYFFAPSKSCNLKTSQVSLNFEFNHFHNSLGGDAVEGGCLIADLSVEVCPELDEEEGVLGALAVQRLMNKLLNS